MKIMTNLLTYLNPRLEPEEVIEKLTFLPSIQEIDGKTKSQRLSALQTIYKVFIPLPIVVETYNKLYDALERALAKKNLPEVDKQYCENFKGIKGNDFCGIIGGVDSISIIGLSGTGKTASINRIASLLTNKELIEFKKPYKATIIPCLIVNCPFDSSVKTLCIEIMRLVDAKIGTNYYAGTVKTTTTTGMLIASVSNILLNHVGICVVDEAQNIIKSRNGFNLIGSLTQLVNSCGVSIVMIANPEAKQFFEQDLKLARRAIGLEFKPMEYGEIFAKFVKQLFDYQFTINKTKLTDELLRTIYQRTGGIPALVISLIHDVQEKAIIDNSEAISKKAIESVFNERYGIIQSSIETPVRKPARGQKEHLELNTSTSKEVKDDNFFENAVKYAKKNSVEIVEYLKTKLEVVEL